MFHSQDVIKQCYFVQMFQHAQCLILVVLTLALTALGIRSTFFIVISVIFYTLTTYINCFSRLQLRGIFIILWIFWHNFSISSRQLMDNHKRYWTNHSVHVLFILHYRCSWFVYSDSRPKWTNWQSRVYAWNYYNRFRYINGGILNSNSLYV